MRAEVSAVTPDEFQTWARHKRAQIEAANKAVAEQRKEREKAGGS
jgi:heme/copper-type cytochrome/quinol oxidase subunit 2